jgi:hypothetical protein
MTLSRILPESVAHLSMTWDGAWVPSASPVWTECSTVELTGRAHP